MDKQSPPSPPTQPSNQQRWFRPFLIGSFAIGLNIGVYVLLPPELVSHLGSFGYAGAFGAASIANASVILPIPYFPILIRLAQVYAPWGIVLAAAAGSTLGESVAFWVGRTGRGITATTPFNTWIKQQMRHPWRAGLILFLFSAPPNPAFDVAGLIAGALGLPLWIFLLSVFLGRIIRMTLVISLGFYV